jgi:hypothetical protein
MSKALALFNSWVEDEAYGFFWDIHTIALYTLEDFEELSYKELKHLSNTMYDYECSYNKCNKISPDLVEGYKYVKQQLKDLEQTYYNHILNTKFKDRALIGKQVKDCYLQDNGETKTYYDVFQEAVTMVLKKYSKKNVSNYLQLKKVTDAVNLKQIVEEKEKELKYINTLDEIDRAKYYKAKRIKKNPEKEKERKRLALINLKEWREDNPDKLKISQRQSMKRYNNKKQDLTTCETTEELAAKVVRLAIAKALKKLADAERYKLKQELKLSFVPN